MFGNKEIKYDEELIDQKTGESIKRVKVPEKYYTNIEKAFNDNGQHAQAFLQLARQGVLLMRNMLKEYDLAEKMEQEVQKHVVLSRENMGLDSSWIYNIQLKMMEKRMPPDPESIKGEIDARKLGK